jgi:hypothetical protein
MELVAGLAPNLKEIAICGLLLGRSARYMRPRATWEALPGSASGKAGSLRSLSIKGHSRFRTPEMLQNWARATNFAYLQDLTLGGCYEVQTAGLNGDTMEWVARDLSFPQLRNLSVYLDRDDLAHDRPHYDEQAITFFQAL